MPNLRPTEIVDAVQSVLQGAARGKGSTETTFLTAYQILHRLPEATRSRLIEERSVGGAGSGVYYSAASVVADSAELVAGIIIAYMDTRDLQMQVEGSPEPLVAGNRVCGLYRLKPAE